MITNHPGRAPRARDWPAVLRARRFGLLLLVAATLAACDQPIGLESHPVGVVFLTADGTEVASFESGQPGGRLLVPLGGSASYRVQLFDRAGNFIPVDGTEFSLRNFAVLQPTAVSVTLARDDQIRLSGMQPRLTTLQFEVWHNGHLDFEVFLVAVQVQ